MKVSTLFLPLAALLALISLPAAAGESEAPALTLPSCERPIGTLDVRDVSCSASGCTQRHGPARHGFGLGGFAMRAMDKNHLAVTPEAMARSGQDLTRLLREAFQKTGCFTETAAGSGAPPASDFSVEASIVRLDLKTESRRGFGRSKTTQIVNLGIDIRFARAGGAAEQMEISVKSDPTQAGSNHYTLLKDREATALDQALADAAVRAVSKATERFGQNGGSSTPTASAVDLIRP